MIKRQVKNKRTPNLVWVIILFITLLFDKRGTCFNMALLYYIAPFSKYCQFATPYCFETPGKYRLLLSEWNLWISQTAYCKHKSVKMRRSRFNWDGGRYLPTIYISLLCRVKSPGSAGSEGTPTAPTRGNLGWKWLSVSDFEILSHANNIPGPHGRTNLLVLITEWVTQVKEDIEQTKTNISLCEPN